MRKTRNKYIIKGRARIPIKKKNNEFMDALKSLKEIEKNIKPFELPVQKIIENSGENWTEYNKVTQSY